VQAKILSIKKNNFAEVKIKPDIDLKIILSDHPNNYVGHSRISKLIASFLIMFKHLT